MHGTWRRGSLKLAPIAALSVIGILIAAPTASGQAAIDQYIPAGDPGNGAGQGAENVASLLPSGAVSKAPSADPGSGSESGGELPFTDYPVTPFIWVVVTALLIGTLVRVAAPVFGYGRAQDAS
jgi:hypothetical protein